MTTKKLVVVVASMSGPLSATPTDYTDDELQYLFGRSTETGLGITSFWHQATFGALTFDEASIVRLGSLAADVGPDAQTTGNSIVAALVSRQAELGTVPDLFVFVTTAKVQPACKRANDLNRPLVQINTDTAHSSVCHELGHAFGLEHAWGPEDRSDVESIKEYDDPTCIMGFESSVGFQNWNRYTSKVSLTFPPLPAPQRHSLWAGVGPRPSGASLARAGFGTYKLDVGNPTTAGRTITLRSPEHSGTEPIVAAITTPVGLFFVEYRTNDGWDDAIDAIDDPFVDERLPVADRLGTGVMIHREHDWPDGSIARNGVRLVGRIATPLSGPSDWYSTHANLRVELRRHDRNTATVHIGLRPASLTPTAYLDSTIEYDAARAGIESGEARPSEASLPCSALQRDFQYWINLYPWRLKARCTTVGIDNPKFRWFIDGNEVTTTGYDNEVWAFKPSNPFTVPHRPTETTVNALPFKLSIPEGSLLLNSAAPAHRLSNGSFELRVDVVPAATPTATPISIARTVKVQGAELSWEPRYYEAWDECNPVFYDGPNDPWRYNPEDPPHIGEPPSRRFRWLIRQGHQRSLRIIERIAGEEPERAQALRAAVRDRYGVLPSRPTNAQAVEL